jgi:hypothetical protein
MSGRRRVRNLDFCGSGMSSRRFSATRPARSSKHENVVAGFSGLPASTGIAMSPNAAG